MSTESDFKWVFNPPKKQIKQPDIITPKEFESLIERVDNEGVDPLVGCRNQAILWMTYEVHLELWSAVNGWFVKLCTRVEN